MKKTIIQMLLICTCQLGALPRDSIFTEAQKEAHLQHYDQALKMCSTLLMNDSSDVDALLLQGLIYTWKGEASFATPILMRAVAIAPAYKDAWAALITSQRGSFDACSSAQRACIQFPSDSTFRVMQQKTCGKKDTLPVQKMRCTHLRTGFETIHFDAPYHRKPWYSGEIELRKTIDTWQVSSLVRAQKRNYGTLTIKAAELEGRIQKKIFPAMSTALLLTLSPYALTDTLYPKHSAGIELYAGLPLKMEADIALRYRDYHTSQTQTLTFGMGRYYGHYLVSARIYTTMNGSQPYLNGGGEIRRFGVENDQAFTSLSFFCGRSPFDGSAVLSNGYLTTAEAKGTHTVFITRQIMLQPSVALGGEQRIRMISDGSVTTRQKIIGAVLYRIAFNLGITLAMGGIQ